MNNGNITDAEWMAVEELTPKLQEKRTILLKLIAAITNLSDNEDFLVLKKFLFDGQIEKLEKQLMLEAKNFELNVPKIQRLNGNLEWAKRFDFYKMAETYKIELDSITKKLNENEPI